MKSQEGELEESRRLCRERPRQTGWEVEKSLLSSKAWLGAGTLSWGHDSGIPGLTRAGSRSRHGELQV